MPEEKKQTSWRTTTCAVAGAISCIALAVIAAVDGNPETKVQLTALVSAVLAAAAAFGFKAAKDDAKKED